MMKTEIEVRVLLCWACWALGLAGVLLPLALPVPLAFAGLDLFVA